MTTFAIHIDVLRDPITKGIRTEGRALYEGLCGVGRVAILCPGDVGVVQFTLAANGLTKHTHLLPEDPTVSPEVTERRWAQVTRLRQEGSHLLFVVEPDPAVAADLMDRGVPVMLYLHPAFTMPSFRPDYKDEATPWQRLLDTLDYQQIQRAKAALSKSEEED